LHVINEYYDIKHKFHSWLETSLCRIDANNENIQVEHFNHLISFLKESTTTQKKQVGATDTVESIDKLKVDNVL
jgi:hypothetical protein